LTTECLTSGRHLAVQWVTHIGSHLVAVDVTSDRSAATRGRHELWLTSGLTRSISLGLETVDSHTPVRSRQQLVILLNLVRLQVLTCPSHKLVRSVFTTSILHSSSLFARELILAHFNHVFHKVRRNADLFERRVVSLVDITSLGNLGRERTPV